MGPGIISMFKAEGHNNGNSNGSGKISLTRVMSAILFAVTIFLEMTIILEKEKYEYFGEILFSNLGFIIALLGIKGYYDLKSSQFSVGSTDRNGDKTPCPCQQQT